MARIKKKGTAGNAKNYITRTQAVRKLQISLPDFRRLCIFKGIYPREPRNKKKASRSSTPATTFYYARDIQYLLHEPLLNKFREHKALAKKIGRALGRGEPGDAARLERNKPRMTLDHVIKERYPTFVDALRDLDDALSMLFLFANLPSTTYVAPKTIALCQRLCLEFEHYLIVSHSLRKSFLSIKGIYYQATIQGQDIMWLVPYRFVQRMAGDIDFRIMATFIEFYTTLLGFVNYRLYTTIGLVYPPTFDAKSDEQGGELGAYTLEGKSLGTESKALENGATNDAANATASADAQAEADRLAALEDTEAIGDNENTAEEEPVAEVGVTDGIDTFELAAVTDADVLPQPEASENVASTLFAPFTFFLSRETPRHPLEFILKAYGCKRVGWDNVLGDGAFTSDEKDAAITHQIVDRPNLPASAFTTDNEDDEPAVTNGQTRVAGRTYIQPQWVWDCINQGKLLRPDLYAPGATLPPHLSPWVKPKKGEYDPTLSLAEQENEGEAELDEEEAEDEEGEEEEEEEEVEEKVVPRNGTNGIPDELFDLKDVEAGEGMDVNMGDSDSESSAEPDDFGGFSDADEPAEEDLSEGENDALAHQRELEAEALGLNPSTIATANPQGSTGELRKKLDRKRREEAEEIERRKMMLPNRKRKLYEKMQYSNRARDAEAEKLRKKKRKIERTGKA